MLSFSESTPLASSGHAPMSLRLAANASEEPASRLFSLTRVAACESRVVESGAGSAPVQVYFGIRDAALRCKPMARPSVWAVLRGEALVSIPGGTLLLSAGDVLVLEAQTAVSVQGLGSSLWMGSLLQPALMRAGRGARAARSSEVIPALHRRHRRWLRQWLRLHRDVARPDAASLQGEEARLVPLLQRLQELHQPLIARCPGRTMAGRRKLYVRLQRARLHAETEVEGRLGISELAKVVCLSPSHFVRIFHQVYNVTPYKLLGSVRLRRALDMVRCGEFGVAEIALAVGFTNRCSFSRWFRQQTGHTAASLLGCADQDLAA